MNTKKFEYTDSKGNPVTVFVRKPNAKDWRNAQTYSVKIAAEFFKAKTTSGESAFLVRANMKKYLEDAGLWSQSDEDELKELTNRAVELEAKLVSGGIKKSEGRTIAIELSEIKDKQLLKLFKLQEFDNLTVEHHTEKAELEYLCSCCILDESGNKIFKDADDFVERLNDEEYYSKAKEELKKLIFGEVTLNDILKDRVEMKYLKHFGYINENYELVNSEGQKVDKDGKVIEDKVDTVTELDFSKYED